MLWRIYRIQYNCVYIHRIIHCRGAPCEKAACDIGRARQSAVDMNQSGKTNADQSLRVDYCKRNPRKSFEKLLDFMPFSLCVREIMRMRVLAEEESLPMPILDVGCGDGLFWEVVFSEILRGKEKQLEGLVGIDIDPKEVELASARLSEFGSKVESIDIAAKALPGIDDVKMRQKHFNTVIANCSIEHVPHLKEAISNIRSLLAPGGRFFVFLPAPMWTETMRTKNILRRFSSRASGVYGSFFDGFFQHHHLYPYYVWEHLFLGMGFSSVETKGIGTEVGNGLFEAHLPGALCEFVAKAVSGKYPRLQRFRQLGTRGAMFEKFIEQVRQGEIIRQDPSENQVAEFYIRCVR